MGTRPPRSRRRKPTPTQTTTPAPARGAQAATSEPVRRLDGSRRGAVHGAVAEPSEVACPGRGAPHLRHGRPRGLEGHEAIGPDPYQVCPEFTPTKASGGLGRLSVQHVGCSGRNPGAAPKRLVGTRSAKRKVRTVAHGCEDSSASAAERASVNPRLFAAIARRVSWRGRRTAGARPSSVDVSVRSRPPR